jgi:WD40 repeat protein
MAASRKMLTLGKPDQHMNFGATALRSDWKRLAVWESSVKDERNHGSLKIYDAETGQALVTVATMELPHGLAYSPDGRRLAAVVFKSEQRRVDVKIWNMDNTKEAQTISSPYPETFAFGGMCSFSPDGKYLAASISSHDGDSRAKVEVIVWDVITGKTVARLPWRVQMLGCLRFSRDGRLLAVGGGDLLGSEGAASVWDTTTWRSVQSLRGHTKPITCLAFTPDSSRLASGSGDGTIKIWNPASGQDLVTLAGHTRWVGQVAFSADGHRLFSATGADVMHARGPISADYLKPVEFKVWDATPLAAKRPAADGKK